MVVEHTFVTTLDAEPALKAAGALLAMRGFTPAPAATAQSNGLLEMVRGKKAASRARSIAELPQTVRIYFDRGRVTVALSIEASSAWGGQSSWGATVENPQKMQLHADLLSAIAVALEQSLAHGQPAQIATTQWDRTEAEIAVAAKRRNRSVFMLLIVVFLIIFAAFVTLAVLKE